MQSVTRASSRKGGPGAPGQHQFWPPQATTLHPHRMSALSAIGDGRIDDASNSRAKDSQHGHNYIDNRVDQLYYSSEGERDEELELHSEELDHDDGFDRVEDEDWEIVEKGKQTTYHDILPPIIISTRLYQTI